MDRDTVVNIGVQRFDRIREQNAFYIDKTDFIREWWKTGADVTLITRPRRFGKTLNMSMVECFFSNRYADRLQDTDVKCIRYVFKADRASSGKPV